MIFKGFRFGMLLQFAVGPICLYIFKLALEKNFINAMFGIIGVVIIDGLFIALSIIGISSLINKNERTIKLLGFIVLVIFGCMMIYNSMFGGESVSEVSIGNTYISSFIKAILLTGSNPLTIIFWSGVFSSKIIEERFNRVDEIQFGLGAVISTFIFLTIIAIIGQFTSRFISHNLIVILNILVGLMLIYFGFRLILKKRQRE